MSLRFLCLVLEMMKSVYSRGEYSDVLQILLLLGVFAMSLSEKKGGEFQRLQVNKGVSWYLVSSGSYFLGGNARG